MTGHEVTAGSTLCDSSPRAIHCVGVSEIATEITKHPLRSQIIRNTVMNLLYFYRDKGKATLQNIHFHETETRLKG